MKHENFNRKEHGFVGHLAEPDGGSDKAVLIIMGGEQSLLPGIKFAERKAWLQVEKSNARILLIAGDEDEAWPAEYSVKALKKYLDNKNYEKEVKVVIYPHGSHLNGLMPNREREKKLYPMIPLIGLMYKTFGGYRKENMKYFEQSEQEIIEWIRGNAG